MKICSSAYKSVRMENNEITKVLREWTEGGSTCEILITVHDDE